LVRAWAIVQNKISAIILATLKLVSSLACENNIGRIVGKQSLSQQEFDIILFSLS